jgi:hypothetical protein
MLWQAWQEIAGRLETANRQGGVSPRCAAFTST